MNRINLSELPQPVCVSPVDFGVELDYLLDLYTAGMQAKVPPGITFQRPLVSDPAYQILSTVAYRLGLEHQRRNEACYATMLAYAMGADLDHIAARYNVSRLVIQAEDKTVYPNRLAILEDDERLRLRVQIAMESWTTAGSRGSYEYHAMSASPHVLDVSIDRPEFKKTLLMGKVLLEVIDYARLPVPAPGDVAVTVLLADDTPNRNTALDAVTRALDRESVIPLTDNPVVMEADIVYYAVNAILYVFDGPSPDPILDAARRELADYTAAHYRLGHDVAVSGLHMAAHRPGVQRVDLSIKQNIIIKPWQAAKCTSITVSLGGRDA